MVLLVWIILQNHKMVLSTIVDWFHLNLLSGNPICFIILRNLNFLKTKLMLKYLRLVSMQNCLYIFCLWVPYGPLTLLGNHGNQINMNMIFHVLLLSITSVPNFIIVAYSYLEIWPRALLTPSPPGHASNKARV